MNERIVTLDVRDDIRAGRSPLSTVLNAVAAMRSDETLRMLAPFEPVPLFGVLAAQGFSHESRLTDSGDWEVMFSRFPAAALASGKPSVTSQSPCFCNSPADVDARGLEPPQPLVVILEALAQLSPGGSLRARTDRRPMHLYAQLEERGFTGTTEEQPDGSFITTIRHV